MANQQAHQVTSVDDFSGSWAHDGIKYPNKVPHGIVLEVADFAADYTNADGKIVIPSGTLVGRTKAERTAGEGYGPADTTNDEQIYLTTESIYDAVMNQNHETGAYRHHRGVLIDQLPRYGAATNAFTATDILKIEELYECWLSPEA